VSSYLATGVEQIAARTLLLARGCLLAAYQVEAACCGNDPMMRDFAAHAPGRISPDRRIFLRRFPQWPAQ
jgi:ferredoxin-NADP reductase